MSVIGIVCEFNPFHNGHKHLIDSVKKDGDTVVCVMSGNFVQRAEPALFPKEYRVKSALKCGADIVLELPFIYATATAEVFCENAVKILASFGCQKLAFGVENEDLGLLSKAAELFLNKDFNELVGKYLEEGLSYPVARDLAFKEYNLELDISKPNTVLALEYIKAIKKHNLALEILPVKRIGDGYNESSIQSEFASATAIRNTISNNESFDKYLPVESYNEIQNAIKVGNIVNSEKYELALMSVIRNKLNENFQNIAYMSDSLDGRIKKAIATSNNLNELYDTAKTKRFTHSRVRRAVLSLAFEIGENDYKIEPPYIRVLGFNEKASKTLGKCSSISKIPVVTSYSQIKKLENSNARICFNFESKSTDFYNLFLNTPANCGDEMIYKVIKI